MKRNLLMGLVLGALVVPAAIAGCDSETTTITCQVPVQMTAQAGASLSDGSVMVYGSVLEAPLTPDAGGVGNYENAVHAVYVALVAAQIGAPDQFNFRSFSVQVPADRLFAYSDGMGHARLPVEAYLAGGCVSELPQAAEPVVPLPKDAGTTTNSGDGGTEGGPGAGDGGADGG
jgi:hypothetical protein